MVLVEFSFRPVLFRSFRHPDHRPLRLGETKSSPFALASIAFWFARLFNVAAIIIIMAPHCQRIPIFYRIFLLYVEPFFSLIGAFYAGVRPQAYLQLTDLRSAPLLDIPVGTEVVLRQLANLYLLFALNEAIVLRVTDDVRVWRALLVGLLIADFGHLYSLLPLGLDVYWKIHHWTEMDWGNVAFVYFGAATRIAFLTGVGFSARSSTMDGQRKVK